MFRRGMIRFGRRSRALGSPVPATVGPRASERRARLAGRLRELGAVTVEFAIVLPLFMSLVFGMIEGSRLMMARWIVSYATERGGRVASLRSTASTSAVQTAVVQSGSLIGITSGNVTVQINGGATAFGARAHGDVVTVTVDFTHRTIVAFIFPSTTFHLMGYTRATVE